MADLPHALRRYLEVSRQPADSAFHTSQVSISFGESVDSAALRSAWELVAGAHAALRTMLGADGSVSVAEVPEFAWQDLDWQAAPPEDLGGEWQSLMKSDATVPIASGSAAPCRITSIRLPNGDGHALWSFHGAVLDNTSISTVLHQWLLAYDALRTGAEPPPLEDSAPETPAPGEDWKSDWQGFVPPRPLIVLPLPEPGLSAGTRRSVSQILERPERAAFAAAASAMNADLRSLFCAAWAFVIARATSADDALILESSRPEEGVGRIENFQPRRRCIETNEFAGDLVRSFMDDAPLAPVDLSAFAKELGLAPSDIEPATAFIFRGLTLNDRLQREMPRWMAADTQLFQLTAPPISLRIIATARPEVALDYDPARLSDIAAKLLFDLFLGTVQAFAADASLILHDFALPGTAEVVDGGEAPANFRALVPQCLHELFSDVAAEAPDATAVEMDDSKLTFSQLNANANQLARHLRKSGVEPGFRVGISMSRSPRWIAALLGALKAGASIVPVPEGSSRPIAGIKAWIVDALPEGGSRDLPVIQIETDASAIGGEKARGLQNESAPTSEAIAWTENERTYSFSHETLASALQSTSAMLGLSSADRVLHFSPTGTFAAFEETLSALLSGSTLVLRADNRWNTRTAFHEFVQQKAITTLSVPTPFWSQWTHYLTDLSTQVPSTLRLAAIHGAQASPNAVEAWRTASGETRLLLRTPASAACGLGLAGDPAEPSILGTPGPITVARLVDKRGLPLPAGFAGWADVAPRGGAFVPLGVEAFGSPDHVFHARNTLQAQVAGPSPDVMAEAIFLAATTHPELIDAFVDQRLIAARHEWCIWIVPRDSEHGEPHDFREWLSARLPSVPRRIRVLPRLPLDEAGNIDVAALTELLPEDASSPHTPKGSEEEERVRTAISRVLGGRRIELDESITDGRTKPQVAKLLYEAVVRGEPRVQLPDFTAGFSVRSLLRNVRGRKSGADSKWTPLEPLRASGKLPPIIFIHDFDGTSKLYASLAAHLEGDQPCYAITARGLSDPSACHTSVVEMARAYVEALRVFDASGPYRLVGYGFGGLVAFEMARQLAEAESEIALLILLAAEPPRGGFAMDFLSGGWKRSLPALFGKKSADATPGRRRTADSPVAEANHEAARKYSATVSSLSLHVFAPTRDFPAYRAVQDGWLACSEEVNLYQVPCSGPDMMNEPAVESLAVAISKLIRSESLYEDPDGE